MINICVLVKPILDPLSIQWDYRQGTFQCTRESLNKTDLHALQWACQYKERHGAQVTVIQVVDSKSEIQTHPLLKWNIDECVLIELEELNENNAFIPSLLAQELKERKPDLVLSGSESDALHEGITPIAIAERLNLPCMTQVYQIEPTDQEKWTVQRKEGRGTVYSFEIKLPALIAVVRSITRLQYVPRTLIRKSESKITKKKADIKNLRRSSIQKLHTSDPQPMIRYFQIPSSDLSAEQRLIATMGFCNQRSEDTDGNLTGEVSEKTIHYTVQKINKWLKEG
jgi:electron transfer flavoprotein alpha/beta subunit